MTRPSGTPARGAGFTLIEMMITLAIVAILVAMAMPLTELTTRRAKEQDLRRSLREIRDAIDAYHAAWEDGRIERKLGDSGYPRNLETLAEGVEDARSPKKTRIYFLRRIPPDPFGGDSTLPPAATWGKRAYATPPDEPAEGDDVFDIFSRSGAIGLDGRPYGQW
jgi:general secretion pathway protein G